VLTSLAIDRRAVLKARHRDAILEAARQLVDERGGAKFSVDELAARADVARRTIFNHFASLDEVLLSLCDEVLEVIIDDFMATVVALPVGDGSRASMFDEIAHSIRTTDLPGAIAQILAILGEPGLDDSREHESREQTLSDRAFARAAGQLIHEVQRRHPDVDGFDVELLVGSLMNGVLVVSRHWILAGGVRLDDEGRARWDSLLNRLIESVRSGYRPNS
jgi:TetR/AcrR family transcriptional regulator of autoinduction and epiphytic fitness